MLQEFIAIAGNLIGSIAATFAIAILVWLAPKMKAWLNTHVSAQTQALITSAAEKSVMLAIARAAPGMISKPADWSSPSFLNTVITSSAANMREKFPDAIKSINGMVATTAASDASPSAVAVKQAQAVRDVITRVLPDVSRRAELSPITPPGPSQDSPPPLIVR